MTDPAPIVHDSLTLNKKKAHLLARDDQTAADWLALADEYQLVGSRGNYAGCLYNAKKLGYVAPESEPELSSPQISELDNAPESQDVAYSTPLSAQGRLGGIGGMSAERYGWQDEGDA